MEKLTYTNALDIAIASVSADSAVAEKLIALKASLKKSAILNTSRLPIRSLMQSTKKQSLRAWKMGNLTQSLI